MITTCLSVDNLGAEKFRNNFDSFPQIEQTISW